MLFAAKLLAHRKKQKLSAEALAKKCGISRSYITLIETGYRMPGKKVLPQIAEALQLKPAQVINWYLEDLKEQLQ